MSLEVFGDEGNAPANGLDTAIYQELRAIENRARSWRARNKGDFSNIDQEDKANQIIKLMDELAQELGEWTP